MVAASIDLVQRKRRGGPKIGDFGDERLLVLLLGIAAIPRLALWAMAWLNPTRPFWPDTASYLKVALHLLETGTYPSDTALRTPVFPTFIALVYRIAGERPYAFILAQILVSVMTVWLTWSLGRRLISRQAAFAAGLLMALSLDSITLSVELLSETTFTFLLLVTVWCWVWFRDSQRVFPLLLSGVLMGMTILCRPIATFFPFVLVAAAFIQPRCRLRVLARHTFLFGACVALVLAPWIWHNAEGVGLRTISTISAMNLLGYYAATVEADLRGITDEQVRHEMAGRIERKLRELGLPNSEANRARVSTMLGLQIIKANPVRFVLLNAKADVRSLAPDVASPGEIVGVTTGGKGTLAILKRNGIAAAMTHFFQGQSWLIWLIVGFVGVLALTYIGAIGGIVVLTRLRAWYLLAVLLLPVTYFLLLPGAASVPRFKVPALPFLSLLAGVGLHGVWIVWCARRTHCLLSNKYSRPLCSQALSLDR